jgi:hypothetical protein
MICINLAKFSSYNSKLQNNLVFLTSSVTSVTAQHNFGSDHTHESYYNPFVDECGLSNCNGLVDGTSVSTGDATIMSYCHQCDGGSKHHTIILFLFSNAFVYTNLTYLHQLHCLPLQSQTLLQLLVDFGRGTIEAI